MSTTVSASRMLDGRARQTACIYRRHQRVTGDSTRGCVSEEFNELIQERTLSQKPGS